MRRIVLVAVLAVVLGNAVAEAQPAYPTRPVEIIVAFAPGGGADVAARLTADSASKQWGQPGNVVDMPGGSGRQC